MWITIFAVVGAVSAYAVGYFRERKIVEPPAELPPLPSDHEASIKTLLTAYGEEVKAKYMRNHGRRKAEKFLKEFFLASIHFVIFGALAIICVKIDYFNEGTDTMLIVVGLIFLTMALKAGQLTAAKETIYQKENYLIAAVERVNRARDNVFQNCPKETWLAAVQARDEKSFHVY